MVEWHGYGRAYPLGRRQIVGAVFHLADREPYCGAIWSTRDLEYSRPGSRLLRLRTSTVVWCSAPGGRCQALRRLAEVAPSGWQKAFCMMTTSPHAGSRRAVIGPGQAPPPRARTLSGRVRVAVPLVNEHLELVAYRGTS